MSLPDNIIGVIGGMGPYAGTDLTQKIFKETIASKDQDHLPVALLSFSGQIDDRTDYMLDKKGRNPVAPISAIAMQLEKLGVCVAGMACNSAHAPPIFDGILKVLREANSTLRILNMIQEVARHIKSVYYSPPSTGILSTNSIFHLGIYKNALLDEGISSILPPQDIQESLVHTAIYDPIYGIKAQSQPVHPQAIKNLATAARILKKLGAKTLVLGCTELPLAIPEATFEGLAVIDPTRILARALIRETHPEKLKPYLSATNTS